MSSECLEGQLGAGGLQVHQAKRPNVPTKTQYNLTEEIRVQENAAQEDPASSCSPHPEPT